MPRALLIPGLCALALACSPSAAPDDDGAARDWADVAIQDVALGRPTRTCPTTGTVLECGQPCILVFKGVPTTLFVEACP